MQTRSKSAFALSIQILKCLLASSMVEPTLYLQAYKSPKWSQAMDFEYQAFLHQHTWSLVPCSSMNVIDYKWVY